MARNDCTVCAYRSGKLVTVTVPMSASDARLHALHQAAVGLADDVEITIYRSDVAMRDWYQVPRGELVRRARAAGVMQ